LREEVLLALVADVWTQGDQVDASYWGEITLNQVRVARVLGESGRAGLGEQALLAPEVVDWCSCAKRGAVGRSGCTHSPDETSSASSRQWSGRAA